MIFFRRKKPSSTLYIEGKNPAVTIVSSRPEKYKLFVDMIDPDGIVRETHETKIEDDGTIKLAEELLPGWSAGLRVEVPPS